MAKSGNLFGRISKIIVRMYRAGTGDFFVLQFKKGNTQSCTMMIDCGCINGSKEGFKPLVEDLLAYTRGVVDLLVVTHEHADHINGFQKSADIFNQINFKKVWFAWTEDDQDPIANDYRANHSEMALALNAAVAKLNGLLDTHYYETLFAAEAVGNAMLAGRKHFINSLTALNGLNANTATTPGTPKPTMVQLLRDYKVIKPTTIIEFLAPGEVKANLPGAKGISFFVLGPPRSQVYLNRTEKDGESFEKREEKSVLDRALIEALNKSETIGGNMHLPFDATFEADAEAYGVGDRYEQGGDWRKIDYDWLYNAGSLALRYERSINNTSVALAIRFDASEKVLLFPGDAEFGNWESWHDALEWPVNIAGEIVTKKAEYFLSKTVFYKVGHHLSQNGTAKRMGVEMMTSDTLAAMATLDFKKIQTGWLNTMPNDLLGAELIRKTRGKLFFVGDREQIVPSIKTSRVSIRKDDEDNLNKLNKPFDGKFFIDYTVTG